MNPDDILLELGRKQRALINQFNQEPRIFDEAEWGTVIQGYEEAGMLSNMTAMQNRLNYCKYLVEKGAEA